MSGSDFLDRVTAARRSALQAAYGDLPPAGLERLAHAARPPRDLAAALSNRADVAIIAEVKRSSPSVGAIAPGRDAVAQATSYERGGAAAVSVLAEPQWFGGSFQDVADVAAAVSAPVLCKDFVVDPVQLFVARSLGADAILLMVSILGTDTARYLRAATDLGLSALVEIHDDGELDIALDAGARIVGVNSRNLRTLEVNPETVAPTIARAALAGVVVVAESGVRNRAGIERAAAMGAHAALVGETLMRAEDPTAAVAMLTGVARR